jgi:hypothetical protein
MQRTILGLFISPPDNDLESAHGDETSLQVDEVQETFDGQRVYSGEAATLRTEKREAPIISDDGEITTVQQRFDAPQHCNWFAMPDADPGFVAVDSSAGESAFHLIGQVTGSLVLPAIYGDLNGFADYVEQRNGTIHSVIWSDGDEAGSFYRAIGSDDSILKHGLKSSLSQFAFTVDYDGFRLEGTAAKSGYCELYSPDDWDALQMAQFIDDVLLQFSGVKDVGSAQEIATDNTIAQRAREQRQHDEGEGDAEADDGVDADQSQLDQLGQLDSVTVADGGDDA